MVRVQLEVAIAPIVFGSGLSPGLLMPLIRVEFVVGPERVFLVTAHLHCPQKPSFQI